MEQRSMTFDEYVSRRLQPVKVLVSMLSKDLKLAENDEIVFNSDEIKNVIATLEIFIEEYSLASRQTKGSRRTAAAETATAYPAEKKPSLKSVA